MIHMRKVLESERLDYEASRWKNSFVVTCAYSAFSHFNG